MQRRMGEISTCETYRAEGSCVRLECKCVRAPGAPRCARGMRGGEGALELTTALQQHPSCSSRPRRGSNPIDAFCHPRFPRTTERYQVAPGRRPLPPSLLLEQLAALPPSRRRAFPPAYVLTRRLLEPPLAQHPLQLAETLQLAEKRQLKSHTTTRQRRHRARPSIRDTYWHHEEDFLQYARSLDGYSEPQIFPAPV